MTEKLYYKDAYTREFDTDVISVEVIDGHIYAILAETAFFPEEGGQASDTGVIGAARVIDVKEKGGVVIHELDREITLGRTHCVLDFDIRFEKMQCHTAEHILCGIIHSLYGYENVGFHLGDDLVTFDVDGELTRTELDEIELLANRAVFANLAVTTSFPSPNELAELTYRAKLDLTEGVRLVTVDGVDTCACCAPHVSRTGEIGIIKILDFMRHRGGTRIFMLAGHRALRDYHHKYLVMKDIGALTSTPHNDIAPAVHALADELENSYKLASSLRARIADFYLDGIENNSGDTVLYVPELSLQEMRSLANLAIERVNGIVLLLTGIENDYKFIIASKTLDIPTTTRAMCQTLGGKGGGRGEMAQGSLSATLDEIKAYFK